MGLNTSRRWIIPPAATYVKIVQLATAVIVGVVAWVFVKLSSRAQEWFMLAFGWSALLTCLSTPLLFLGAVWLVRHFGPGAEGSGIPQVLQAIEEARPGSRKALSSSTVSLRTAVVKIFSAGLGMLGGASIGREGPTVQIASSIFAFAGKKIGRFIEIEDYRPFLVAGAATGVSAAFNTPLAGIAFALEEVAEETFSQFKGVVMLCVFVAGITSRALGGNYLYFGRPAIMDPSWMMLLFAILVGALGGLFGGLFSRTLTQSRLRVLPASWWMRALVCGAICALIAYSNGGLTSGSGYEVTKDFVDKPQGSLPFLLLPEKFFTTIVSYLSGMAGGIFSPCLSIGTSLGVNAGQLLQMSDLKACALVGMVAFFSGVVHAPLTAVIIVMEMTDQHTLIIPFLAAAYLAHSVGSLIMPVPLYKHLAFHMDAGEKAESESRGFQKR
jgi:H+/Cl- antiporter ClcA